MNDSHVGLVAALAVSSALVFSACAHQQAKITAIPAAQPASQGNNADLTSAAEPDVRGVELRGIPQLRDVRFDCDSAELSAAAREILRANAGWLKEHPEAKAQVAGYCDQRGTEEYNLALGQRRAESVRRYYRMLGVWGSRIATISYGKDKLLCDAMTESCWRQNRRAQTLVAVPTLSSAAQ